MTDTPKTAADYARDYFTSPIPNTLTGLPIAMLAGKFQEAMDASKKQERERIERELRSNELKIVESVLRIIRESEEQ